MTRSATTGWDRMAQYVHEGVAAHPALEPIRAARQPVVVHAHERAIFATCLREVAGNGWRIEVRVEAPEWWLPLRRSHGDQLTETLAAGVRERWQGLTG